jgi:hypothetical protein
MQTAQFHWQLASGWTPNLPTAPGAGVQGFALAFGTREAITEDRRAELRAAVGAFPLVWCTTSGEIAGEGVHDGTIVVTTVAFAHASVQAHQVTLDGTADSRAAGRILAARFAARAEAGALRHVLVFSDGLAVNGTGLVAGLADALPAGVTLTGGLAGDGTQFAQTLVGLGDDLAAGSLVAVGIYGESVQVGFGSMGGWDAFGPERHVDQSAGNVLHRLDGEPALDVYKRYLGDHIAGLPGSALLFPLAVTAPGAKGAVTRTILAVDEATGSMTFAGDVPEGAKVRLMKANHDRLVDGAEGAAGLCVDAAGTKPDFALLISCVGRKLVLGQRVEEEVEAVAAVLGAGTTLAGFYSYGELAPRSLGAACELHNQTMTVTTFREAV